MPLFISLEGPDGSGKSTQARLLVDALRRRGLAVTESREPGGTELGDRIRELVLHPEAPPATPLVMAFLLSASRSQLVSEIVAPALLEGRTVVVDRFADSTVAYQSFGLGVPREIVETLTGIATGGVLPDIRVYIDVPADLGLERVASRGDRNRLDAETLTFHERVRGGYLQLISEEPHRWICVDGAASPPLVHCSIMAALEPVLERGENRA